MAPKKSAITKSHDLAVEWMPVGALTANPRNARSHTDKQVRQLASAIRKLGFINPIIVDEGGMVLAGHCRLAAAKLLGAARLSLSLPGAADASDLRFSEAHQYWPRSGGVSHRYNR